MKSMSNIMKGTQRMKRINRWFSAVLCAGVLSCQANAQVAASSQVYSYDPDAAIERARQGDPDDLLRMTRMVAKQPSLVAVKKLAPYHAFLKDTNVFVQCYAVQVLVAKKDKSSAEPLRQFILHAERRRAEMEAAGGELDELARKGAIALSMASTAAQLVLGEIDEGSPLSVKLLASQLKRDISMEWGGGVAHSALARKGRAGLRALMDEAAGPLSDDQERYLEAAIAEIEDPALAVDLFVFCKDQKYNEKARHSALMRLRDMAKESTDIEQMVIRIAEDEKSDLRSWAIIFLSQIGSDRARSKLLDFEKTQPTMLAEEADALQRGLMALDASNRLPAIVEASLSPKTPVKEKERLFELIFSSGSAFFPYADRLLVVSDYNGVPINNLRYRVWKYMPDKRLELDSNKQDFDRIVGEIAYDFERELYSQDAGKWKYTDEQRRQMALDRANSIIKVWDGQKAEEKQ